LAKQISAGPVKNSHEGKRPGGSSQVVYLALRDQILQNQLSGNQSLKQDKIAASFGVSKIPVREALKQLEADGLIEFKPRRGAFVVELSEYDIIENLEIRIGLECHALQLAIPNMTATDIKEAQQILEAYQQVSSIEGWSELNRQFHHCIYAPCGFTKLLLMIDTVKRQTHSFMRLKISQVAGFERPHAEHLAILEACKANDVTLAVALVRQHIECTKKEVTAYFRRLKQAD